MQPGELLRMARLRNGLSQKDLAERAGSSQPAISALECGRRDPSVGTMRRLIAATGERLELRLAPKQPEIDPPSSPEEHGARLVDALLLADATGHRRSGPLEFPHLGSASRNQSS